MSPLREVLTTGAKRASRFRWIRFRVRTLVVVVLLIGGALGWLGNKLSQARHQREAVTRVLSLQGSVDYGKKFRLTSWGGKQMLGPPLGQDWLRDWLGDDFFDRVTEVAFFQIPELCDDDLTCLDAFPDLADFHLGLARVTDAGIAHLGDKTALTRVVINRTPITDRSVEILSRLPRLSVVDLNGTAVTDVSLASIGQLTRLRVLSVEWSNVTDAGLVHLTDLRELSALDLSCTEVSDAGIVSLAKLKSLKQLSIGATRITREGKEALQSALRGCSVTWWARVGNLSDVGGRSVIPKPNQARSN